MTKAQRVKMYGDSIERRADYLGYDSVDEYLDDEATDYVVIMKTGEPVSSGAGVFYYEDQDEAEQDAATLGGRVISVYDWIVEENIW